MSVSEHSSLQISEMSSQQSPHRAAPALSGSPTSATSDQLQPNEIIATMASIHHASMAKSPPAQPDNIWSTHPPWAPSGSLLGVPGMADLHSANPAGQASTAAMVLSGQLPINDYLTSSRPPTRPGTPLRSLPSSSGLTVPLGHPPPLPVPSSSPTVIAPKQDSKWSIVRRALPFLGNLVGAATGSDHPQKGWLVSAKSQPFRPYDMRDHNARLREQLHQADQMGVAIESLAAAKQQQGEARENCLRDELWEEVKLSQQMMSEATTATAREQSCTQLISALVQQVSYYEGAAAAYEDKYDDLSWQYDDFVNNVHAPLESQVAQLNATRVFSQILLSMSVISSSKQKLARSVSLWSRPKGAPWSLRPPGTSCRSTKAG